MDKKRLENNKKNNVRITLFSATAIVFTAMAAVTKNKAIKRFALSAAVFSQLSVYSIHFLDTMQLTDSWAKENAHNMERFLALRARIREATKMFDETYQTLEYLSKISDELAEEE